MWIWGLGVYWIEIIFNSVFFCKGFWLNKFIKFIVEKNVVFLGKFLDFVKVYYDNVLVY